MFIEVDGCIINIGNILYAKAGKPLHGREYEKVNTSEITFINGSILEVHIDFDKLKIKILDPYADENSGPTIL